MRTARLTVHLGVDLLFLEPGRSGGRETHAREVLRAIRELRPDLQITMFVNHETAGAGAGWWSDVANRTVRVPSSVRSRPSWAVGELMVVAGAAARARVTLLHSIANFGPVAGPFARVLTVHDVLFRRLPAAVPLAMRLGTEALLPPAARRAHAVIAVSDAARDDAIGELGLDPERVVAVPNGFGAAPRAGDAARARATVDAGDRPIVLSVASDLPHKNLTALLDALRLRACPLRPLLVIVGAGTADGRLPSRVRELDLDADVRLLGAVPPESLEDLFAAASAYVAPTRHEGFGLPVLEAMARGVPVACSDLPVLREVAGGSAVFFDPDDPATIHSALGRMLAGGPEVDALRTGGRAQAAAFTWERSARGTLAAYDIALQRAGRGPSRLRRASQ